MSSQVFRFLPVSLVMHLHELSNEAVHGKSDSHTTEDTFYHGDPFFCVNFFFTKWKKA